MENVTAEEYIKNITKASTYFIFRNGPINRLYEEGKIRDEDFKDIQVYMQNHLAYIYNILLKENNINKFDLIISTMNKFFVNDDTEITMQDDGFDKIYKELFSRPLENIKFK